MIQKNAKIPDNTEARIRTAAEKIFLKKGYSATTIRDIAAEADINIASLNYYFRSKDNLFDIVMKEKVDQLFGLIFPIVNNEETSLSQKIDLIIDIYTNLFLQEPNIVGFVVSEIQNQPERFANFVNMNQGMLKSVMARQVKEKNPSLNVLQFILCFMGMIWFPFMIRPILQGDKSISDTSFSKIMKERKDFIQKAILVFLKTK